MSIDGINGVTGAGSGAPAPRVDNPGALLDRDAFLRLLVAQLKYQDPTNPADASQMLAQSAQLTMVDRLNEMAEAFSASASVERLTLAGTLVGKQVAFIAEDGQTLAATVQAVRLDGDALTLEAGGWSVPLAAVSAVLPAGEPQPVPA